MAFEIACSIDPRMLVLRAYGPGTSIEGQRAFQQVQAHAGYYPGIPILVDAIGLQYAPSTSEARVFAGVFATAFPCSLMALVARAGEFYEAANTITALSIDRGATVAAFTDRQDALAWFSARSGICSPGEGDAASASAARR